MKVFKHDFNDGNGEVDAIRHENGGGIVAVSAKVEASAYIGKDAQVSGNARVSGNAQVSGNARVYGNAQVYGNALVYVNARVYGDAKCTKTPIVISGGMYTLTATDIHISIGCKINTLKWWKAATRKQIEELEYGASKHFAAIKAAVKMIEEIRKYD